MRMRFRVLAVASCFVSMCLGLVGCTGSTGVTVQNPVLPPSITTEPANVTVTAGQSATFSVVASGTAPLSYQWQKNGANISGATSSVYTTPTTTTADNNSTFDVVVSNAVGSVTSHTATLIVNPAPVEPSITTQPASQTVTAGQTATFTVVASGTAPLSYQWQKNGANISGATSSVYTTPTTTTADNNSTFDVVVSNAVGSVTSHTAALIVNAAPVEPSITTQPASQTVTAGQTATFTVVASGTAPLSYQWQKNGANISGATSSVYTTPTTTTADNNSTFDVVVSNAVGSVTSHTAALIVNAAPVEPSITTQPASQTVTAGQTATFTVVASGTAPLSYQWQKNGANISGATSSVYTTPTTTTADNNSTFDVVVSNAVGSVTSHTATLTVTPSSSVSVVTNSLPSGQMQAAYVFPLQATGGTPPYTWSASASSVPLGLTLSPAGGIVAGIPTVSGVFTLNVQVRDAAGGSGSAAIPMSIATPPPPPSTTLFGHAILVVEENHNYGDVVGSSSMPYLNSLISQFGLATQYYANTHPSIGNYFMLTTGQTLTNDDSQTPSSFPVSGNNVVRELLAAGKTWKSYAEDLPSVGYIGGNSGNYYVRHNPLAYLTDVQNSATQQQNLVPFTQFAADLASGSLPNYSFIVPNACHDAHNCDLGTADNWLKTNLDPLIKNSAFQNDGLLIIAFDESADDDTDGGGRIAVVLISPRFSKVAFQSTILYQHETVLRLMLEGLGATTLPGSAATAPTAWDFFAF